MTDISKMIGRLEKATGPDRELDGEIFEVVGGAAWKAAYARAQEPCGCPHETAVAEAKRRAPAYSASLDAALTLKQSRGYSIIEMENGSGYQVDLDNQLVDAPTAELGVCIAALKARSANTATDAQKQK